MPIELPVPESWKDPKCCHGCGGLILKKPLASQLKKYPNRGRFCSQDCVILGEAKECTRCGNWFRAYRGIGTLCIECRDKKYLDYDPIKRKAWSIGANIIGGKGKTAWLITLITEALDTPCIYCGTNLTLLNINLDHIEPIGSSDVRKHKAASVEIRTYADRRDNLRLICHDCNLLKGKIPHLSFVRLLSFLETDKILKKEVLSKMRQSGAIWGYKKKNG